MVDPSGGPYLTTDMKVEQLSPKKVDRFESVDKGWKIYLK